MIIEQKKKIFFYIHLLIPIILCFFAYSSSNPPLALFFTITLWAVLAWSLDTFPNALVAILLPVFYLLAGVVSPAEAFQPWAGTLPWLMIGGLIMGQIMLSTGLAKRIAINAIKFCGVSFTRVLAGLIVAGFIIAPFVPSLIGKSAIMLVICIGICDALKLEKGSKEALAVMLTGIFAVGTSKLAFLTGGADVIMTMELAAAISGEAISWGRFTLENMPLAILYSIICFGLVLILIRPKLDSDLKDFVEEQYQLLGSMTKNEYKAMCLFFAMIILMSTDFIHGIPSGFVLLFIGSLTFFPQIGLSNEESLQKLNWGVIFFVVGTMCIGTTANTVGLGDFLEPYFLPFFEKGLFYIVPLVYFVGMFGSHFITVLAAQATFVPLFSSIAQDSGYSVNLMAYLLLYGTDQYFFPFQYAIMVYFFSAGYFRARDVLIVTIIKSVVAFLFVSFIAVPYWLFIGV